MADSGFRGITLSASYGVTASLAGKVPGAGVNFGTYTTAFGGPQNNEAGLMFSGTFDAMNPEAVNIRTIGAVRSRWDARGDAALVESLTEPVGVVAPCRRVIS
ncbi:hypothetical protein GGQ85_003744 [Nitrobacter vulgaris]|jgi:hypothetical protein|nr:hypothetical protein [Nitrobacter vulgaris]